MRPTDTSGASLTPAGRRLEVAAGAEAVERWRVLGELPLGSAVVTDAGRLAASVVLHVALRSEVEPVGPRVVGTALRNALRRAEEWDIPQVALPLLGAGPGGLSAEVACEAMAGAIRDFLAVPGRRVVLCLPDSVERAVASATWPAGPPAATEISP